MPDTRKHRGPHPADPKLFSPASVPVLREAVADYSWLLTRGYAEVSALKLVGDRFQLEERQRIAVRRSSCSATARAHRRANRLEPEQMRGGTLDIDGFNLLTTIEAVLAGGVILLGRDGCHRDLASMHGNYRKVAETRPALVLIGEMFEACGITTCRWWFDSPVSNSGRLSSLVRELAAERGWRWETELVPNPDAVLSTCEAPVASADGQILDACRHWFDAAGEVIRTRVPDVWRIDLSQQFPLEQR